MFFLGLCVSGLWVCGFVYLLACVLVCVRVFRFVGLCVCLSLCVCAFVCRWICVSIDLCVFMSCVFVLLPAVIKY